MWRVSLKGHKHDLENLIRIFHDCEIFSIEKDGEDYYLRSDEFNDLDDVNKVADKCKEILEILNGTAVLLVPDYRRVESRTIAKLDTETQRYNGYLGVPLLDNSVRIFPPALTLEGHENIDSIKIKNDRHVILDNKDLLEAIKKYSHGNVSWDDLFKIYEIIERSGYSKQLLELCGISKKTVSRFTHTCQSPDAIGEEARHAKFSGASPKDPMDYDDAKNLIKTLLLKWFEII